MQLDSSSAEAHTSLAVFKLFYEYDWPGCEREFRRAIALNPNYAFAHDQFAMALAFTGRFDESIAESGAGGGAGPAVAAGARRCHMAPMFQKNFEAAKELARKADGDRPHLFLSRHGGRAGSTSTPASSARQSRSMKAATHGRAAVRDRVPGVRPRRRRRPAGRDGGPGSPQEDVAGRAGAALQPGARLSGAGRPARALDNLERALAADSQMMPWLGRDAMFDSLRSEPRFKALLKKSISSGKHSRRDRRCTERFMSACPTAVTSEVGE